MHKLTKILIGLGVATSLFATFACSDASDTQQVPVTYPVAPHTATDSTAFILPATTMTPQADETKDLTRIHTFGKDDTYFTVELNENWVKDMSYGEDAYRDEDLHFFAGTTGNDSVSYVTYLAVTRYLKPSSVSFNDYMDEYLDDLLNDFSVDNVVIENVDFHGHEGKLVFFRLPYNDLIVSQMATEIKNKVWLFACWAYTQEEENMATCMKYISDMEFLEDNNAILIRR